RYVAIVYIGAAILGKVAGEVIMTDRLVADHLNPATWLVHGVEAALAVGVILAAMAWQRYARKNAPVS
ncbi:MAG: TerC family protein, partial [Opitutus sp.]